MFYYDSLKIVILKSIDCSRRLAKEIGIKKLIKKPFLYID